MVVFEWNHDHFGWRLSQLPQLGRCCRSYSTIYACSCSRRSKPWAVTMFRKCRNTLSVRLRYLVVNSVGNISLIRGAIETAIIFRGRCSEFDCWWTLNRMLLVCILKLQSNLRSIGAMAVLSRYRFSFTSRLHSSLLSKLREVRANVYWSPELLHPH